MKQSFIINLDVFEHSICLHIVGSKCIYICIFTHNHTYGSDLTLLLNATLVSDFCNENGGDDEKVV